MQRLEALEVQQEVRLQLLEQQLKNNDYSVNEMMTLCPEAGPDDPHARAPETTVALLRRPMMRP